MGRHNSMRLDEGRKGEFLVIKMKARTVVGRGEKSLPTSDPGSQLRPGREKEKGKERRY